MRVELEQGSLEWHEHRAKYRNASEAGSVMGVNPYQTPRALWESKMGIGKKFVGNVATDYGTATEPYALARFNREKIWKLKPAVFIAGEYSASLDGFSTGDDGISISCEIKCPYQKEDSKLWKSVNEGIIPEHYYWQLVHQYMVRPVDWAYFFVYVSDDIYNLIEFMPNQGDIEKLREAWDDFYANPPEPKFAVRDDLIGLAEKYVSLKQAADAANKSLKSVESLLKLACDVSSVAGNVHIQTISKKGTIDYKSIPDIKDVDFEEYRKPTTTYKKVTIK